MNVLHRLFVCAALCGSVACSESGIDSSEPAPAGEQLRTVVIGCGGIDTRTDIEETPDSLDGKAYLGVRWSSGDCIRLWARKSSSEGEPVPAFALENTPFEFDYYSPLWSRAAFTGHEVNMAGFLDDEGNVSTSKFDYFAVSPAPKSVEGTSATFDIPAVQSGEFNCGLDIMTAQLTGAPALEAGDTNWAKGFCLPFKHHVHVLKIEITNNLLKSPKSEKQAGISAIELTFPVPVTGQLTVDAATGKAQLEEGGENVLTLRFATPKKKGDVVYAFIAPQESFSGDIKIKATGASEGGKTCSSVERSFTKPEGMFACGTVTPVHYNIPERYRCTKIIFSLTEKDGEAPNRTITVDAENGYGWGTLGEQIESFSIVDKATNSVLTWTENGEEKPLKFTCTDHTNNTYAISCTAESEDAHTKFLEKYAGKECIAKLTSEHAEVECSFTFPPLEAEVENPVPALAVPYLFSLLQEDLKNEDKTSYISASDGHYNPEYGVTVEMNTGAKHLGDFAASLTGWSAVNVMVQSGAIGVNCRSEFVAWVANRYRGRIDSAPLKNLTSTKKVKVSMEYTCANDPNHNSNIIPIAACGYTTETNVKINSADKNEGWVISNATSIDDINGDETIPLNGTFEKNFKPLEYTIDNCDATYRLSWEVGSTGSLKWGSGNANSKLYIRNIKVSIAH